METILLSGSDASCFEQPVCRPIAGDFFPEVSYLSLIYRTPSQTRETAAYDLQKLENRIVECYTSGVSSTFSLRNGFSADSPMR
jgi:hypothetical protein